MCGIVGFTGAAQAAPILLDGLAKLEYRGYDSAGMAVQNAAGKIEVVKAKGRLKVLSEMTDGGSVLHGQTGRVIAAVFQFRQAIQQNGRGLRRTGEAYDSTHSRYPPLL